MTQSTNTPETITFGGTSGVFQQFQFPNTSNGTYYMSCYGSAVIDSIRISPTAESNQVSIYGGTGGSFITGVYLRPTTTINIKEVWFGDAGDYHVVSVLVFSFVDDFGTEQTITFGSSGASKLTRALIDSADLYGQFYGGYFGGAVDQLMFVSAS